MAAPRYRGSRGRNSWVARIGVALGVTTIAVAIYAFVVTLAASAGTMLPAPNHWVSSTARGALAPPVENSGEPEPLPSDTAAGEAERLTLAQSLGTAVHVLEQTATPDGTWPTALAVSTDAASLATLDGIGLTPLPPGTEVLYSTSADLREFSLTLTGPLGAMATYESTTRTLASSPP